MNQRIKIKTTNLFLSNFELLKFYHLLMINIQIININENDKNVLNTKIKNLH